ncbi:unnamed protein product [Chilo suppressalis]|uniref:RRM domain-containing protein n=1 Tax=Chilo suppressalis TaxID=168631 RepID=A0ABN8AU26_CHISP|nr:unnamed protein product [Chilo suppressalis]
MRNDSEEFTDEEGFTTVQRRKKRLLRNSPPHNTQSQLEMGSNLTENLYEVCITSKERLLPKHIAVAKLLKTNKITNIIRIKYKNGHKVLIQFDTKENAEKLLKCEK